MDAVEYLKTFHILCKSQDGCSGCISGCPLLNEEDGYCIADISERAKEAVQIVEQWAKDHQTYVKATHQRMGVSIQHVDYVIRDSGLQR